MRAAILKGMSQSHRISAIDGQLSAEEAARPCARYVDATVSTLSTTSKTETEYLDKQKEVYIDLGAREGAYNGLHMGVYTVKMVAGKEAKKQIGKLKIEDVQGDDISLCKVQSGGRDIKKALDDGETLVIETTD